MFEDGPLRRVGGEKEGRVVCCAVLCGVVRGWARRAPCVGVCSEGCQGDSPPGIEHKGPARRHAANASARWSTACLLLVSCVEALAKGQEHAAQIARRAKTKHKIHRGSTISVALAPQLVDCLTTRLLLFLASGGGNFGSGRLLVPCSGSLFEDMGLRLLWVGLCAGGECTAPANVYRNENLKRRTLAPRPHPRTRTSESASASEESTHPIRCCNGLLCPKGTRGRGMVWVEIVCARGHIRCTR